MLETARAMRTYTTTQVAPLLDKSGRKRSGAFRIWSNPGRPNAGALQKAMPRLPAAKEQRICKPRVSSLPTECTATK